MRKTVVINVVGLSMELVTPEDTPALHAFLSSSAFNTIVEPAFPALTCTAQANYLTGEIATLYHPRIDGHNTPPPSPPLSLSLSDHLTPPRPSPSGVISSIPFSPNHYDCIN
jgi:hypothetical protein